jgi:hypothetical protein
MLILLSKASSFDYIPKRGKKPLILTRPRQNYFYKLLNQDYHKEVSKRQGEEVIDYDNKENLRNTSLAYLEAGEWDKCPSGYAFNYSMMQRLGY